MIKQKYALRFPDLQTQTSHQMVSPYSEQGLRQTANTFRRTFNAIHSLADYVIQKNRTQELEKQLNTRRQALDAQIEQAEERERIALTQYSQQLKIKLEAQKKDMELTLQKLTEETNRRVRDFSLTVEEARRTSRTLLALIRNEQETLNSLRPYLDRLKKDYENRKEYSQCCDLERKAYERIRIYLDDMI